MPRSGTCTSISTCWRSRAGARRRGGPSRPVGAVGDPQRTPQLSVVILAIDEAAHLEGCVQSAAALIAPPAGELVVVLDGRATAAVEAVARRHTAQVYRVPFVNFSAQR